MAVKKSAEKKSPPTEQAADGSQVDKAYQQILREIVEGKLAGGTPLTSTQLAGQLGTSRTPVVQALQRLAADGIITLEVNKRAVVRHGAENWLVDIHRIRELLEPAAAAAAAERMHDEQLAELTRLAQQALPGGAGNWMQAAEQFDFALHLAIADACGNLPLGEIIRKCWSYKQLSYAVEPQRADVVERGYQEHLAILDALRRRDGQTASAAVLFHLRSAATLRSAEKIV